MKDKITVIGSLNFDIITKVSHFPVKGETLGAEDAVVAGGGKGANQAVQAAKLGADVFMVGSVGKDAMGDFLLSSLNKYGVDTSHVRISDKVSGLGMVNSTEDGSVTATLVRGANFTVSREDVDAAEDLLAESDIVILQMEIPMDTIQYSIEAAKKAGCRVILNAAPALPIEEASMMACDLIVVNEVEASFYAGGKVITKDNVEEQAAAFANQFGNSWLVTLGGDGSGLYTGGKFRYFSPCKTNVVETTGAGDSYIGGIAYALTKGKGLEEACEFAQGCSAVTISRFGAQDSMPVLEEVERYNQSQK
ncbi:MAG: ribokinase [Lachnospiraceae bacterium]|nr:ribokinase [Lachnospiraceae bacterium]